MLKLLYSALTITLAVASAAIASKEQNDEDAPYWQAIVRVQATKTETELSSLQIKLAEELDNGIIKPDSIDLKILCSPRTERLRDVIRDKQKQFLQ